MSSRGQRAVPPPADHHSELLLAPDGLVVTVVNKAGFKKEYDFAALPVPEPMQRSLAAVFAVRSSGWTSHLTSRSQWRALQDFAEFLSRSEGPLVDLEDLTVAMLKRWRVLHIGTNTGKAVLGSVRAMLRQDARLAVGPVAEELARRIPKPRPAMQSYEKAERDRVVLTAQRQFRSAWMRISENARLLETWGASGLAEGSREWRLGQILDHIACTGDAPRIVHPGMAAPQVRNRKLLGGSAIEKTWGRLFLTRMELTALAVLLTDKFAWNLSVYDRMPAPSRAPSAAETSSVTYQVQIEKRRAGAGRWFSTENITDSGADSPGRLITQALQATAPARALAARLQPGTDLLMTARMNFPERLHHDTNRPRPVGPLAFGVPDEAARRWARGHGLSGSPFRRVRRTTVTREGRPLQHAQGTHESVYVLPDERVQRDARAVIEAGAREALEQARTAVFGGKITAAAEPDHQETATVDCEDETTSPWPAPEGGCGADFLLCLACSNAHVHPGHHPRLAHLLEQLQSLRSVLDERAWHERWNEHVLRLEDLRDKVGSGAWKAALDRVDETDGLVVQLLVKGELAP
ncbi:hypothetical protein [Streptomyces sp. NPDC047009]|uniref:hypothetical protein n=1 Tax=Streptomyces sp. NPDC047009 TaxID=3154496 RepID=UPI00340A8647